MLNYLREPEKSGWNRRRCFSFTLYSFAANILDFTSFCNPGDKYSIPEADSQYLFMLNIISPVLLSGSPIGMENLSPVISAVHQ
jgi:hypothetical protein